MSIVPGRIDEISGASPGRTPKLPSVPGTTTISTISESNRRSGVTSSNCNRSAMGGNSRPSSRLGGHLARFCDRFVDRADHVEGALRQIIVVAGDDAFEPLDRVLEADEHAGGAGEHLGDEKRLGEKALDLAGTRDGQLVFFGELIHPKDGNDVLQRFVGLQHPLYLARNVV